MANSAWDRVPIDAQSVDAPLSRYAIFLIVEVVDGDEALGGVRAAFDGLDDLLKTVGFRDLDGRLSCVTAIGAALWSRLDPTGQPRALKPFTPIDGPVHKAPSTPGDLLFHIRAERSDLCFEFEKLLIDALGDSVRLVDETACFRYFDARDLLGFVDGTANPSGRDISDAALVGDEDREYAGGSYVVTQKYLHDLAAWKAIGTDRQEEIVGRTKADNIELDDATGRQKAHKTLATVVDADGVEHDILRDNMPFGSPGRREFGTYFIGYARHLWVTEKMLERMFGGDPEGAYDRILDFSAAQTGNVFFAPSISVLARLASGAG